VGKVTEDKINIARHERPQFVQNVPELVVGAAARGKLGAVGLPERADQRVSPMINSRLSGL